MDILLREGEDEILKFQTPNKKQILNYKQEIPPGLPLLKWGGKEAEWRMGHNNLNAEIRLSPSVSFRGAIF